MTDESSKPERPIDRYMAAARASGREHLAAVGYVASQWATLEMRIDQYAVELGRIPFQAGCLTHKSSDQREN